MKKETVLRHFNRKVSKLCQVLSITRQAVSQWPDIVPKGIAYELQVKTRGRLKVDERMYLRLKAKRKHKPRRDGLVGATPPPGALVFTAQEAGTRMAQESTDKAQEPRKP